MPDAATSNTAWDDVPRPTATDPVQLDPGELDPQDLDPSPTDPEAPATSVRGGAGTAATAGGPPADDVDPADWWDQHQDVPLDDPDER